MKPLQLCQFWLLSVVFCAAFAPRAIADDKPRGGEEIYRQLCAGCHGEHGEGVVGGYDNPLVGDKSVAELTALITETMPAGDAESCVGEDAELVAAYIYDAFYSPLARARNEPPRIELSRLTVRQYRSAVTDLIAAFIGSSRWDDERGLKAEYFNDRRFRGDKRVIERRDARVDFDYGEGSPDKEKIESKQFAARWQGCLYAPVTGEYEIILESENGCRLWLNDDDKKLIDAWVKSGDQTEYRASIFLLGGHAYRLRLGFFKYENEKTASIRLKWKRPGHVEEVIPARFLGPHWEPPVLAVDTPFPPDDRSRGYERGAAISKAWDAATTYAAIDVADFVVKHLDRLADCKKDDPKREKKLRRFCHQFVERAFRRPLSEKEKEFFVERRFKGGDKLQTSIKKIVLLALKSPRFLYRELDEGPPDDYTVASRLSFAMWDSIPDRQLLDAAARGQLETRDQIVRQAERMVQDPRAKAKLREFFHQWLRMDRLHDLAKDSKRYPDFSKQIASDLRTSLDLFVHDVVWSGDGDFRQLFLAKSMYLNGSLAKFYGADLPADAKFEKVAFQPDKRAGVLTHPYLMAGFAYNATSSPIHRGVFLSRSVLGRFLKPPPVAVAPLAADLHADLTTRERVTLQTNSNACMMCHGMINPLGFSLEHFDAVGRYRKKENGQPIDARGSYLTQQGERVEFTGARELAAFLAASPETHKAFVEQLFHHQIKQPILAYGLDTPDELRKKFAEHDFNVRKLLVEIATTAALGAEN